MNHLGIEIPIQNTPAYDTGFIPLSLFCGEFLKQAKKPVSICIERNDGLISVRDTFITGENRAADRYYIERTVKFLLWMKGGFRVTICGDDDIAAYIKEVYSPAGARAFDCAFMARVYEHAFEVLALPLSEKPREKEQSKPAGGNFAGCRIGFDAGGSDRKVSAVIGGEAIYSEEVVWSPKTNPDPDYHFHEIVSALRTAQQKMPRVDAIGVSSAGIYIDNRTMVASLFIKVPPEAFEAKVKDIYIRAAKEIGDVPLHVFNDGDVTALAGAMELADDNVRDNAAGNVLDNAAGNVLDNAAGNVLGIAMGTSEAGGFVDAGGNITGWLNELAFAPVDASAAASADDWSGDIGCGVKYFSQEAVIKLAGNAGISLDETMTPGEKLKAVQTMLARKDPRVPGIFESVGCYLGHALPYYWSFYGFRHVLLLGRVMSGEGGNIILETARKVLAKEYPECIFQMHLPDEKSRRVGQSVAAASL